MPVQVMIKIMTAAKHVKELEEMVSDQAIQIHILKKTQKIMEQLKKQERFIREHLAPHFGVQMSCKALGLSMSTYYYKPKPRCRIQDEAIAGEIVKITETMAESGYRPVTLVLATVPGDKS